MFRRAVNLISSYLHFSLSIPESLKKQTKKKLQVVEHVGNFSSGEPGARGLLQIGGQPVYPASSRTAWTIE